MSHVMGGVTWALGSNTTKALNSSALVGNSESLTTSSSGSER